MTKDEIRQEIEDARKRHSAELKALEAKLNEPEKWEPKGGEYLFKPFPSSLYVRDCDIATKELPFRTKTSLDAIDLAAHLKRQAILWQLANDLNKGWKPDWDDINQMKFRPFYDHSMNRWDWVYNTQGNSQIPSFKDTQTARKACEILNNQPELMQ